jgi:hypothetical protein
MDLFVAPTIGFNLLYGFIVVRLARGRLVWVAVTTNRTVEWIARQISEAFPWNEAPRYLIRDRDRVYGTMVTRRVRAMGIRDKPIACGSPRNFPGRRQRPPKRSQQTNRQIAETKCVRKSPRVRGDSH